MPYKVTVFFESSTGLPAGWTESFYTNTGATVTDLAGRLDPYISSRAFCLHPDYSMLGMRINDITVKQSSILILFTAAYGIGKCPGFTPGDGRAEQPFDGLLSILQTGGTRRRGFIMRGIPDVVIDDTYSYVGAGNALWSPQYDRWRAQVLGQRVGAFPPGTTPWLINNRQPSTQQIITSVTINPDRLGAVFGIANQTNPAIDINSIIRIRGDTGAAWFNGIWKVFTVVAATPPQIGWTVYTFPKRRPIRGTPNLSPSLKVTNITPGLLPVATVQPSRGAKRSTGRPFELLRGKRPVQQG